jgi:hypothetical protein
MTLPPTIATHPAAGSGNAGAIVNPYRGEQT